MNPWSAACVRDGSEPRSEIERSVLTGHTLYEGVTTLPGNDECRDAIAGRPPGRVDLHQTFSRRHCQPAPLSCSLRAAFIAMPLQPPLLLHGFRCISRSDVRARGSHLCNHTAAASMRALAKFDDGIMDVRAVGGYHTAAGVFGGAREQAWHIRHEHQQIGLQLPCQERRQTGQCGIESDAKISSDKWQSVWHSPMSIDIKSMIGFSS